MLYQVHAPVLRFSCTEGAGEDTLAKREVKPHSSRVAREIVNPTAAETNMGREEAGHWFLKVVEEMQC